MRKHFSSSLLICVFLICGSSAFAQRGLPSVTSCPAGTHKIVTNHHTGCAKDVPGQNNSGSQSSSSGSSQQKEQQAWAKYDKAERDYDNDHAANVAEAAAARQAGRCSEGFGAITPSCADAKRRQSTHENNASDAASRMNSDNHACHDAIKAVKEARDEEQQEELQSIRKQPTPSSCKGDYQGIMRH